MFKELKLSKYKMKEESSYEVLHKTEYGIVATLGKNGYCYGVPVNYVLLNNAIYFHCAVNDGHKIENINYHNKVSFTVVGDTKILPNKLDTRYDSIVVFGQASIVESKEEKIEALKAIVEKYAFEFIKAGNACIENSIDRTNIIKISIEHISGKSSYLEGDVEK